MMQADAEPAKVSISSAEMTPLRRIMGWYV
jgi:hypothetical protein